jgi:hypothetical protein
MNTVSPKSGECSLLQTRQKKNKKTEGLIAAFARKSVGVKPQIRQVRFEETESVAVPPRNDGAISVKTVTQVFVLYSEQVIKKVRK